MDYNRSVFILFQLHLHGVPFIHVICLRNNALYSLVGKITYFCMVSATIIITLLGILGGDRIWWDIDSDLSFSSLGVYTLAAAYLTVVAGNTRTHPTKVHCRHLYGYRLYC